MKIRNRESPDRSGKGVEICTLPLDLRVILLGTFLCTAVSAEPFDINATPPTVRTESTEKGIEAALSRKLSGQWERVSLRQVLRRIGETNKIAVLLDRRLNPDLEVNLKATEESVQKILERMAETQAGMVKRVGHTLYIGPQSAAAIVRTVAALRRLEVKDANISSIRQQALVRRETLAWGDLTSPRELLDQVAKRFGLKLNGLEQIPYDLWGYGTFQQMTGAEMLTLLLIQYDRTFEWTEQGSGIRIVPIPSRVAIDQAHAPPRGKTSTQAAADWLQAFPNAKVISQQGQVLVTATVEDHEAIELSNKPAASVPTSTTPPASDDLSRQRFTMPQVREARLSALIATLSAPSGAGLTFNYDEQELKRAGLSLEQRVSFSVKGATIQTLLQKALEQTEFDFELQGKNVRLFPKGARPGEKK